MATATAPASPDAPIAPNAHRLLWAGFVAILAAGVGFAIRGAILDNWRLEFGFTDTEIGRISGQGLTGFCFGVIIGGVIADKIGYGKLVIAAFLFHIISAVVTLIPGAGMEKEVAYNYLFWGSFIFALANGTLEAVANPLVATLFPNNRTHYLNILHASWPAGLILGGALALLLDDYLQVSWQYQWAIFLVPAAIYGLMFLGQRMPQSEAASQGLSFSQMMSDVGILGGAVISALLGLFAVNTLTPLDQQLFGGTVAEPTQWPTYIGWGIGAAIWIAIAAVSRFSVGSVLLFVLFVTHMLVGSVELGTDTWIQDITGNLFGSEEGKYLFIFASLIMFGLRFCAHFIEKTLRVSPIGLLFICAVLACLGLNLISYAPTFAVAFLAVGVYAFGKTFFWPTMLAVTSDRFPRTGAVAISIMGGIGMISGGLLGAPGLGYAKDRFSHEALTETVAGTNEDGLQIEYQSTTETSKFLWFEEVPVIDGGKLGEAQKRLDEAQKANPNATLADLPRDEAIVVEASREGARDTLRIDSLLPGAMAVIYLGLLIYFMTLGGYRVLTLRDATTSEGMAPR